MFAVIARLWATVFALPGQFVESGKDERSLRCLGESCCATGPSGSHVQVDMRLSYHAHCKKLAAHYQALIIPARTRRADGPAISRKILAACVTNALFSLVNWIRNPNSTSDRSRCCPVPCIVCSAKSLFLAHSS